MMTAMRASRKGAAWGLLLAGGLFGLIACSEPAATVSTPPPAESTPADTSSPTPAPTHAPTPRPTTLGTPRGVALPNPHLTPGQTFAGVMAAEVCTSGWASRHRDVTQEQYYEVYGEYGIAYPEPPGTYELDHLIPLELGGDNANANLWPEPASPAPGFHQKDDLENALHHLVCAGSMDLSAAQHAIASNWYAAYLRYVVA